MASPDSSALLPPFGTLLTHTWHGFRTRFWLLTLLAALFSFANLVLQLSFFGAMAWSSFIDYLAGGAGEATYGIMPLFVSLSGASLWIVIPVVALTMALQIWFHASLVVAVWEERAAFGAILWRGVRLFLPVAAQLVVLFLSVRVMYFLLAFVAGFFTRYVGTAGGSLELLNRALLLVFALALMVAGIITGFSLLRTAGGVRNPLAALQEGARLFLRQPWGMFWRVAVVLLLVYVTNELVAQLQLTGIPIQWQALLSLFYVPFLFFFLLACYRSISKHS